MKIVILFIIIAAVWLIIKHSKAPKKPYILPKPERTEVYVSSVYDGDTVQVTNSAGNTFDVRLYGIDTPELSQPYGLNAMIYLKKLVEKKNATMYLYGLDKYNRVLGVIYLNTDAGHRICVNKSLVSAGLAESYLSTMFDQEHVRAQEKMRGMWAQGKSYISPQIWRDLQK